MRQGNHGELVTSLVDGQLRVDRADPEIALSEELWTELEREQNPAALLAGDVLTVKAVNGVFTYRLTHWGWDYGRRPVRCMSRVVA